MSTYRTRREHTTGNNYTTGAIDSGYDV